MRILTVPEDTTILRSKSQPVEKIDAELLVFLKELGETLKRQKDPQGIGLSAVQVGRAVRVFAIYLSETNKGPALPQRQGRALSDTSKPELVFYINPEIVSHPKEMTLGEDLVEDNAQRSTLNARPFLEGCLSIPNIYGPVLRWLWIEAKAVILSENDLLDTSQYPRSNLGLVDVSLNGLTGRVFQHELDHLNGILFTDHVLTQGNQLYQDFGDGLEEVNL